MSIINSLFKKRQNHSISYDMPLHELNELNEEKNAHYKMADEQKRFFKCHGAGEICFEERPYMYGTGKYSLPFGVSWGKYGFLGGNIFIDEAKKMAEYILQKCDEAEVKEQEMSTRLVRQKSS